MTERKYFDGLKNSCPCLESNTIALKYCRMPLHDLLSGGKSKKKISAKRPNCSNRTKLDETRKLLTYILKSPLCELQTFNFSRYFKISLKFVLFIIVYVHELRGFSIFCTVV
jgi:hypothetical protein